MTCTNKCAQCKCRDSIAEQMKAAHHHLAPNGPQDIEDNILRVELVMTGSDLKSGDAEIQDVVRRAMECARTQANTPVNGNLDDKQS